MTIQHIWPVTEQYSPVRPIILQVGEIEEWDFSDSANQIYYILTVLDSVNLIKNNPFQSPEEVKVTVSRVVNDIDLESDVLQISESKHIRVEFRDELLSIEVFVGV